VRQKNPKQILAESSLYPKKSFGQNFMMDDMVNLAISKTCAEIAKNATIIEIGAGTGALTEHLLEVSKKVYAIERDRDLVKILKDRFYKEIEAGIVEICEADAARFSLKAAFKDDAGILVGNLPYHLTSSIMLLALKNRSVLLGCVFLIQSEVALRLLSKPGSKDFSFLTAIMSLGFSLTRIREVSREAFWPVPKVDSTVIALKKLPNEALDQIDIEDLVKFVRSIFQKRRKQLKTILREKFSESDLLALGIDPKARPEDLEPEMFLKLYFYREHSR